ncbi:spinocerebellar ataxia type 10 protein domain-containing protein [Dioszegia hungarica]|uniref:Ataxin-10 homolog n=1 Tax=Dioszegia hungarica TaxID=4972 RepID=A0AA38LU46_9TREE|nr:spinocerebellar ataxia type 10 protein domain-containing protein [Dioszegia hungarica]KAI9637377.1 spinocerebellar ataxia type 10 protein domain-containing protein [Dioszegia hungarica]
MRDCRCTKERVGLGALIWCVPEYWQLEIYSRFRGPCVIDCTQNLLVSPLHLQLFTHGHRQPSSWPSAGCQPYHRLRKRTDSFGGELGPICRPELEPAVGLACSSLKGGPNLGREWIVEELQEQTGQRLWSQLGLVWERLAKAAAAKLVDVQDSEEQDLINLSLALAKLERNLLAGIEEYQRAASGHEEAIRSLLFHITTFSRIEDEKYHTLHAVMTQLLSNLISPIHPSFPETGTADEKLAIYLSGNREDDVIARLLDSKDPKTNSATIHLLNNLTRQSRHRCELILSSPAGISWLSRLLDRLEIFHDASDGRFELSTQIFTTFIDFSLHPRLFGALASVDEVISPSQTSLLKVLDAYIQRNSDIDLNANLFLIQVLHLLSAYCVIATRSAQDDPRLPKVLEGLHLVCEILCAIGLAVQARIDEKGIRTSAELKQVPGVVVVKGLKLGDGERPSLIRPVIDLLKELEVFQPRTNPRLARADATAPIIPPDQARPIAQLKRVLVELLGVLTFGDTDVGDQVREAGGVQLVLGMTEMDEGNPYLREHALLVVRNLMLGNPTNQALIGQMDPVGVLGQNGELLAVPERMKRSPGASSGDAS